MYPPSSPEDLHAVASLVLGNELQDLVRGQSMLGFELTDSERSGWSRGKDRTLNRA